MIDHHVRIRDKQWDPQMARLIVSPRSAFWQIVGCSLMGITQSGPNTCHHAGPMAMQNDERSHLADISSKPTIGTFSFNSRGSVEHVVVNPLLGQHARDVSLTMSLSQEQIDAIAIAGRVTSGLSILGTFTIIGTFCLSRYCRSPIHRIIFYNSFYNLVDSIATMISVNGPQAGDSSSLCQFQGFVLQMCVFHLRSYSVTRLTGVFTLGFHLRMCSGHLRWHWTLTLLSSIILMLILCTSLRPSILGPLPF